MKHREIGKTQITGTMPAEIGNLSALENMYALPFFHVQPM